MIPTKSILAVLFALGSAGALAQNQVSPPPTGKPVSDSASYGPVLNPEPTPPATQTPPASTQQAGEARPQAQEERAGVPPSSKHLEVDPSARPAPDSVQPQRPQAQQQRRQPARKPPQTRRRPVEQRIEPTARIIAPAPQASPAVQARVTPAPVGPQSSQVVGCAGSACTDVNGATYNAPGAGNVTTSSSGRLCTRNGANLQCI